MPPLDERTGAESEDDGNGDAENGAEQVFPKGFAVFFGQFGLNVVQSGVLGSVYFHFFIFVVAAKL